MTLDPIKLLVITASPRGNGNSAFLSEETAKGLVDSPFPVEVTARGLAGKKMLPCNGCLACYKNGGRCVLDDDFEVLRGAWIESDAVLYVFPVYHVGVPGQLKCFIDRLGNSFYGYYTSGPARHMKVIGALPQGGVPMGGQEMSNLFLMAHASVMHSFFVAGDSGHMGTGFVSGRGGNRDSFREMAAGENASYLNNMENARNMLLRVVETAAILKAGVSSLGDVLEKDSHYTKIRKKETMENEFQKRNESI
jgi:multimeric flavodoxin WrbA